MAGGPGGQRNSSNAAFYVAVTLGVIVMLMMYNSYIVGSTYKPRGFVQAGSSNSSSNSSSGAHPAPPPIRPGWHLASNIAKHSKATYSQRGQDGIIDYIFDSIGYTNRYFVEFGYNSVERVAKSGPNTALLAEKGWKGLLLDGGNENPEINLHKHFLCPSNIIRVFELRGVPPNPDYVSIDIDGYDPWLFDAIIRDFRFRPRVISIEFNVAFPRSSPMVVAGFGDCEAAKRTYGSTKMNSASPEVLRQMGAEAGYALVYLEGDAFFVLRELIDSDPPRLEDLPAPKPNDAGCFNAPWERHIDRDMMKNLWDYKVWLSTADAEKANAAAVAMVAAAEKECGFKLAV